MANSKLSWNSPSLKASNWLTSSLGILGCRNRIPTVGKPSGQFVPSISYLLGILSGGSHRDAPIVHKGFAQNLEFPYAYLQYLIRAGSELGTTNWMLKNTYYWFKMSQKLTVPRFSSKEIDLLPCFLMVSYPIHMVSPVPTTQSLQLN